MELDRLIVEERDSNGIFAKAFYDAYPAYSESEKGTQQAATGSIGAVVEVSAHHRLGQIYATGRRHPPSRVIRYLQKVLHVFLPTGYPDSVTPDYIHYQTFDSIQAFASSIAQLLGSRAVLTLVGVGDQNATSTSALFFTVSQETLGRLATIMFAWRFGSMLEQECKKFRFAADLVNDTSIFFDVLSPHFIGSPVLKLSYFCLSGILKAVCTVMANGSKAALTQHFTDDSKGSIADVAAKDASQETIISLLGMLAGAVIVPILTEEQPTWIVLFILIATHLATNYRAVSSVVMETLNRHRANIVFSSIIDAVAPQFLDAEVDSISEISAGMIMSPKQVSRCERILERDGVLRWGANGPIMGKAFVGSFSAVRKMLPPDMTIEELLSLFGDGNTGYVLWYRHVRSRSRRTSNVYVQAALIEPSDSGDEDHMQSADEIYYGAGTREKSAHHQPGFDTRELRVWVHALFLARKLFLQHHASMSSGGGGWGAEEGMKEEARQVISSSLRMVDALFGPNGKGAEALKSRGWALGQGRLMVVAGSVPRLRVRPRTA
ncbi:vitamin B6 photo-protection and homoeostasis-domain-containing protein [Lipomyces oligophaga]|uniref:vitamin B6 photo-protection and homoeostasis-domain-containing protein n=1 Tax=Lipomyces oligophaga TaxID=45792 RepID=UPI0034CD99BF